MNDHRSSGSKSGYVDVGPAIIGVEYGKLGAQEISDAAYIAAANPAVVLELVRRLRAVEKQCSNADSLTIGNVNGDATLYGSKDDVRTFHLKLREIKTTTRQAVIEECIDAAHADLSEAEVSLIYEHDREDGWCGHDVVADSLKAMFNRVVAARRAAASTDARIGHDVS